MSPTPRTDAAGLQIIGGSRWVPESFAHQLECELAKARAGSGEELNLQDILAAAYSNSAAHGFWDAPRNKGEMFMLMVCELAEGFEAVRCKETVMSDHIPEFTMEAEEMADEIIRVCDYCGGFGIDLEAAVKAKMAYNRTRPHKHGKLC